jgi:acyl-CoA reductase-like NAD-dependent aldehyde dehydrogenase
MTGRLPVNKTYKLYIGGKFPRTESGRYYKVESKDGFTANVCQSSRKDFREAVVVARSAFNKWHKTTAMLRSQILYRIAEMLEGRKAQFVEELEAQGSSKKDASAEVDASVERLIHYAGWADKYQQIFGTINPVASSHFNFSVPVATGVIAVCAEESTSLLGLVSVVAPLIVGGNTVIVVPSFSKPLCSITFAEVLDTSDVPAGVVNILTGDASELAAHMSSHMDVNTIVYCGDDADEKKEIQINAAENMKRVRFYGDVDWNDEEEGQSPYFIMDAQEIQTTWHPIGI